MRPVTPRLTYAGIAVAVLGFAVLAYTWGEVAGLASVALQMPYLLSGGGMGIGLVLSGLTIVVIAAKRDAAMRQQRDLTQLHRALVDLRVLVDDNFTGDADSGDSDSDDGDDATRPLAVVGQEAS